MRRLTTTALHRLGKREILQLCNIAATPDRVFIWYARQFFGVRIGTGLRRSIDPPFREERFLSLYGLAPS